MKNKWKGHVSPVLALEFLCKSIISLILHEICIGPMPSKSMWILNTQTTFGIWVSFFIELVLEQTSEKFVTTKVGKSWFQTCTFPIYLWPSVKPHKLWMESSIHIMKQSLSPSIWKEGVSNIKSSTQTCFLCWSDRAQTHWSSVPTLTPSYLFRLWPEGMVIK